MKTDLDVDAEVLLEALNDGEKAKALMAERGWTEDDLVARAEALNKSLVESMASVNVV
ncbi:hypothetical protein ABZ570_07600 [Micromonospora sp. NPDC007271]|uniref:hypothetical protein n=1 Tax=Micromonospora sp. NPDC007271 TaxID=3154587 RepID=UPI0033C4EDC6